MQFCFVIRREANIYSLHMMAQLIDGAIDGILQKTAYHGYVLIRNQKFFAEACVIDVGVFTQPALTEPAHTMIEFFDDPTTEEAVRVNMFLFI